MHCIMTSYYVGALRNLQIIPTQSTYKPGDRIQCSAESNPEPSYQWQNMVTGADIQGDVFDVSAAVTISSVPRLISTTAYIVQFNFRC